MVGGLPDDGPGAGRDCDRALVIEINPANRALANIRPLDLQVADPGALNVGVLEVGYAVVDGEGTE